MHLLTFLFQLNRMVPIDPDCGLTQRIAALGDIATCLKELSPGEEVGELFPEPHSQKHLHIVVWYPEILSSPSGEHYWLVVAI